MIKEMRIKLLAFAILACAGVSSVHAQGWSHTTSAGQGPYSTYYYLPFAFFCQQIVYTYGGPPVQVINDGPMQDINDTSLDSYIHLTGVIPPGNYYIYQYVYSSPENNNAGGTSVTIFTW
jgi:hypothetical protein